MAKWSFVGDAESVPADDSPNFLDNAPNSTDQETAVKHWVERAVELQAQGAADEDIAAQLAAAGCPQPEEVVVMMHMREETGPGLDTGQGLDSQVPDEFPPAPQSETPDTQSMYSKFVSFVTAGMDDVADGGHTIDEMGGFDNRERVMDDVLRAAQMLEEGGVNVYSAKGLQQLYQAVLELGHNPTEARQEVIEWANSMLDGYGDGDPEEGEQHFNESLTPVDKQVYDVNSPYGDHYLGGVQKGSSYPEHSYENAPDHSAPGHHLPDKVNAMYNAIMREHPDYGKEKAIRIAWERSGEKHETDHAPSHHKDKAARYQGLDGEIRDSWQDMFGTTYVRFATELGTFDVPADHLEEGGEGIDPEQSAMEDIGDMLVSLPTDGLARAEALAAIHTACRNVISSGKASVREQMILDELSLDARLEEAEIRHELASAPDAFAASYLASRNRFSIEMTDQSLTMGNPTDGTGTLQFAQEMLEGEAPVDLDEESQVFVHGLDEGTLDDANLVNTLALNHASALDSDSCRHFTHLVELARRDRLAHRFTSTPKPAESNIDDMPLEGLFL
jgi:hypothetical protein